jgi:hypothetical protein
MTIPYISDSAAPAAVLPSPATLGGAGGPKAARRMRRRPVVLLLLVALVLAPAVGWGACAAVTWLTFADTRSDTASDPLMARYLPRYDITEVHQTRVSARPSTAYAAARRMDLQRSDVVHAIFRGRELMLRATPPARERNLALVDEMLSIGWGVLEEIPGRQIVLGAVTQPWQANVVFRALPPASYAAFDSAGYVKLVVTLAVDSLGPRESVFRTETRALATDPAARAKFRRYSSIFSPGILLIRSEGLKLVRRDAERVEREISKRSPR